MNKRSLQSKAKQMLSLDAFQPINLISLDQIYQRSQSLIKSKKKQQISLSMKMEQDKLRVELLKQNDNLKINCFLCKDQLNLCVLNKETGEFFREPSATMSYLITFNLKSNKSIIKDQLQFKERSVVFEIKIGLLLKTKEVQLLLDPLETIPKELFSTEVKAYRNHLEALTGEIEQLHFIRKELKEELLANEAEIRKLKTDIQSFEDQGRLMQLRLQEYEKKRLQFIKLLEQKQIELQKVTNELNKERQTSEIFYKIKNDIIRRNYEHQRTIQERNRKIKELQTHICMSEKENSKLHKEILSVSMRLSEMTKYSIERESASQEIALHSCRQRTIPSVEPDLHYLTQQISMEVKKQDRWSEKEEKILQPKLQEKKVWTPRRSKAGTNLKGDRLNYLHLEFNLSEIPELVRHSIERDGIIKAEEIKTTCSLFGTYPIPAENIQCFSIQILKTSGKDIVIGICKAACEGGDEHKIFMREGSILRGGAPIKIKSKRLLQTGDVVQFQINFQQHTLKIIVKPEWTQIIPFPSSFSGANLYYYLKLFEKSEVRLPY